MKSILRLVAVIFMVGCFAVHARAQTSSATISGHVVDQTGGVVPNADVSLINQETNVTVATHTNGNGDFLFPDTQPGSFAVVVHGAGYKELRQVNLVLNASQSLSTGTLVLHLGAVTETVMVSAEITPLQTTSAERSAVLDNAQMENLLAIGRDAMALTRLNPGVVGGGGSSSLSTTGTPTVNGVNSQYNLATVDGVSGNTRGGGTFDTPPNMDAIQEVTMLESSYSAANGKVAGANFNFVTKNGTSHFHGGIYYYFRNEDLNANSYFNKFNGATVARPRYRYNTYGGTLGGPIFWPGHFNSARNKLFFFVSIENSPIRTPDGTKFFRIPTQMELKGDFSQTYQAGKNTNNLLYIRNPAATGTCSSTAGGAACFTNNQVPVNSSQGETLLQILYDNTIAAHPGNYIANNPTLTLNNYNYVTNNSSDKSYDQQIVRVDYDPTERLHLYSHVDQATINNNGYASTTNKYTWAFPVNYQLTEPSYSLDVTYTFTPSIVNEFTFGASAWNEYSKYDPANIAKVQLGASGFNLPSLYAGVNPLNLFPGVSFGGVPNAPTYGWDSRFPFNDNVLNISFSDGLTKVSGPHSYKFGFDYETDTYLQTNHNRVGTFAFDQNSNNPNDSNFAYSNA
ncbi:MAG: carboxypeptidase-like regulatory domain-containing protein, partial [Acidobacteriota bacterium]|nr:carboxypeptidase-like regulatory domain-containing protein [Acidobacteriota bacterium]